MEHKLAESGVAVVREPALIPSFQAIDDVERGPPESSSDQTADPKARYQAGDPHDLAVKAASRGLTVSPP
jgi:hypothetical protein